MQPDEPQPQQVIDLSGVSGTWCLAYLFLPIEERERGLYATALNFCVTADGALADKWQDMFPKLVDALRNGPPQNPVATFPNRKPILSIVNPDDKSG